MINRWSMGLRIFFGILVFVVLGRGTAEIGLASKPATFTVNAPDDMDDGTCDGAHCSLREAINAANSMAGADSIIFSLPPSATITLAGSQLPVISDTLTIDGGTANNLTIDANFQSRVFEIGSGATVTITTLTISNGVEGDGGAIYNDGGILVLMNSTIRDNYVFFRGGGIHNAGGMVTISDSTFQNNWADIDGGGLYNGNIMVISNSTISGNGVTPTVGPTLGGGIYNEGVMDIRNSTLSDNVGSNWHQIMWGGGIYNFGTLDMSNTIIANSIGGGDCINAGVIGINNSNLVEDGGCSPALVGDPLLGPLQDNGGLTWTHALMFTSLAIDAGDDVVCAASPVNNLDQRGVVRPIDGDGDGMPKCDIGAYEYPLLDEFSYLPLVLRN